MSTVIAIMGESGSGKTTAMRNLPPEETYYIDADEKGLSWKGWKNQYSREKKNYYKTSERSVIEKLIKAVNENRQEIKYIVVDTLNGIMLSDEFERMKERGYDKWQDLALSVYSMIVDAHHLRDDLTVIFICHSQTDRDDDGYKFTRIRTSGKKLDKIVLESKFTTVLLSVVRDGRYMFETKANRSTAKTPLGLFDESEIDNDILKVINRLKEYEL